MKNGSHKHISSVNHLEPQREKQVSRTLAIIPCYNEETSIGRIIIKAKQHVDDGSIDNTKEVARLSGAIRLSFIYS